jgi:hypothetical protein
VSSYLALQNDSAGDLQNRRVRAIHGKRIRVGPGSARPASMEGERPMPPRIYAPQPPWKGRVRCRPGSERPELQEGVADGGARLSEAVGHVGRSTCFSRLPCQGPWRYIGSGEVVVATPSRTPTPDLNPTGASRAVPKEDHMASKAACKRRMGITRGVELSRRAIPARWLSRPEHRASGGGGRGVHYREGAQIHYTTRIWLFAECHILCRVFYFGHSANKLFAECHAKNPR